MRPARPAQPGAGSGAARPRAGFGHPRRAAGARDRRVGEVAIGSYEAFTSTEVLGRMAMERMLAGLSSRRYPVGLEPVGEHVEEQASSRSKSAVSRKFVKRTETALAELLDADLSTLDLVVIMIDGVQFAEHTCIVALGIDSDASSTRCRWSRVPPRTPPWSPSCVWTCAAGDWMSPSPSWPSSTAARHCGGRWSTCSTRR